MSSTPTETSSGPGPLFPSTNSLNGTWAAGNSTSKLSGIVIVKPLTDTVPPDRTLVPEETALLRC